MSRQDETLRRFVVRYGLDAEGRPLAPDMDTATLFEKCRAIVCDQGADYERHGKIIQTELPYSLERLENLVRFELAHTDASSLPKLPDGLETLVCRYNMLTTLGEELPPSLTHVYCVGNRIVQWPKMPDALAYLNIFNTLSLTCESVDIGLAEPERLPNSLRVLILGNLPLAKLPKMPENLKTLQLFHCGLAHLPKLPESVKEIDIYENGLTSVSNDESFFEAPFRRLSSPSIRKLFSRKESDEERIRKPA